MVCRKIVIAFFVMIGCVNLIHGQNLYNQPESAEYDVVRGRYLVSNWGDGNIVQIDRDGTESFFDTTLASSVGMVIFEGILYVSADTAVVGFDLATGAEIWSLIIPEIGFYNDLAFDSSGYLYVTDYMQYDEGGGVYRINIEDRTYNPLSIRLSYPNGVMYDQNHNRLIVCGGWPNARITAIGLPDGADSAIVFTPFGGLDGLAADLNGNIYVSSWRHEAVYRFDPEFEGEPALVSSGHSGPADIFYNDRDHVLVVTNLNANTVDFVRIRTDQFTRVTEGAPVNDGGFSTGANWVDYDNDDYPDLFVPNWYNAAQRNVLYHNNGDGTFTKVTDGLIVNEGGSLSGCWADYDNDGDVDVYLANPGQGSSGAYNFYYLNNGDGSFTKVTDDASVQERLTSMSGVCADYDNDGDLDLYVSHHCPPRNCSNSFFRNDGGTFTQMDNTELGLDDEDGSYGSWCDYDGDGDLDLYNTRGHVKNALFQNNWDGTFTRITHNAIVADSVGGCSWGDYDNDGDFDLFIPGSRDGCHKLYNNVGNGEFIAVTGQELVDESGWNTIGSSWGDYDNDGDLDLVVVGNLYYEPVPNALYENNGDGTFTKVTESQITTDLESSAAAAWGDYDRDGDLDLFIPNVGFEDNALYRNNGNANNWITIRCIGFVSNRSAIGAKVKVRAIISGEDVWQVREISGQTGAKGQNSLNAHFGLGDAAVIDEIRVEWPSGILSVLTSFDVNQFLTIVEGEAGDSDGDGILDEEDNCPYFYNPDQGSVEPGDIDCRDGVDVVDVLAVVNHILNTDALFGAASQRANCNGDGRIDVLDVVGIVNVILGHGSCVPK
ncbi:MAG: VCBS repeat-containing protein [Gemmatimonadota bacterium]|nr:MAG: VCBS repeat-containing protein [Gemmatimonadota bacterium]